MESQKNIAFKYKGGQFSLVEEDKPKPAKGEVLIKVAYSTINPYDRILYSMNKDEGLVLGCDGCGIVEEVGEGVDAGLKGKKVSFAMYGW